ncbi:SDR family NAD(P)-dependent oxidoreductase [Endozoicomonas montiporae]|uniref:Short-chain dehydrogenase n=1 Tax=Endozoicomonas montiporae CL-33 TaxID=570277 RepID=A0A142B9V4_9GAMM|nr:SDR family NAD(P)-dependent oxidoreductase [Endozoicomonas montiporae]AMO55530.1 short-chain dehydrogenase [Endozoicomonas montiporae CL-33]
MKDFKNKVAVITGAGSGIGREIARQLAVEGCNLALVDVNPEGLAETAKQLEPTGVTISQHVVDVTDRERMMSLPDEVLQTHSNVNLLFNNAGISFQRSFEEMSIEDWELSLGINLWGVIYGSKAFLPLLKKAAGEGEENAHIVNLSSMAGFVGLPNQSSYSSSKAAVRSISESLWTELKALGIGVTSVHPGAIRTNIFNAHKDKNSNQKRADEIAAKVDRFAMEPDQAAQKIIQAVRKNKQRQLVGKDAVFFELMKRFMPSTILKPFANIYAKGLKEQA